MRNFLTRLGAALYALGTGIWNMSPWPGVRRTVRDRWEWIWWDVRHFFHHSKIMHPLRAGHWLARVMDDAGRPAWADEKDADAIPSYRYMRWNTRNAEARHQDMEHQYYYWSDPGRAGTVPCVESWLHPYDVITWLGRRYTLWRLEVVIQVWVRDDPVNFSQVWYGLNEDLLLTMFIKYQGELRDTLKGESQPVYKLRELHSVA